MFMLRARPASCDAALPIVPLMAPITPAATPRAEDEERTEAEPLPERTDDDTGQDRQRAGQDEVLGHPGRSRCPSPVASLTR